MPIELCIIIKVLHQWGGNFKEFIAIARYHKGRLLLMQKLQGTRGFDFDTLKMI
jgi:hypothetical protein